MRLTPLIILVVVLVLGVVVLLKGSAHVLENDSKTLDEASDEIKIYLTPTNTQQDVLPQIQIGTTTVFVEIVDTPESRAQGLSGREGLLPDTGMLFVFDTSGLYGFWMREMRFAIDIIWIDENFFVVHVEEQVSPDTFPMVFKPREAAQYVLEVSSGFVAENDVSIGDRLQFLGM